MTAVLIPLSSNDGFGESAIDYVFVGVVHERG
jgi:hypothetical protein